MEIDAASPVGDESVSPGIEGDSSQINSRPMLGLKELVSFVTTNAPQDSISAPSNIDEGSTDGPRTTKAKSPSSTPTNRNEYIGEITDAIEPMVEDATTAQAKMLGDPSTLASNAGYLTRSKEGHEQENQRKNSLRKQKEHNVVVHQRLKPILHKDFDINTSASATPPLQAMDTIANEVFYQMDDHPGNKRGFKYKPCRPNAHFTSNLYSTTEFPPYNVRASYSDRSQGTILSEDASCVTTPLGWRSVRSNVGVREGKYYVEFIIKRANEETHSSNSPHVRIGWARREASLEAPVGFDGYSYGFRDVNGVLMTLSRPKDVYIDGGFSTGDVIGLLIDLPPLSVHQQAVAEHVENYKDLDAASFDVASAPKKKKRAKKHTPAEDNTSFVANGNVLRDQVPIKYKNYLYYEQYEYTSSKIMDHLLNPVMVFGETAVLEQSQSASHLPTVPNSLITVFKNGVRVEQQITDLILFLPTNIEDDGRHLYYNARQLLNDAYRNTDDGSLGYYPMILVFQHGVVGINGGPDFNFPIEEPGLKPLSERYDDSVIEEWYWDLIDEVEAQYLDSFA